MASLKVHILRCTSFRVAATYEKVGLTPKALRAAHLKTFERHEIEEYTLF